MSLHTCAGTFALLVVTLVRGQLAAQEVGSSPVDSFPRGTVTGTVLDAGTGSPLAGATVVLEPRPNGVVSPAASGAAFWASGAAATSGSDGSYRFSHIPAGRYRLLVRRFGYHPAILEVDLRQRGSIRVSVGLVVQPILLEVDEVRAPSGSFARRASLDREARGGRLTTELYRQAHFLPTDARVLTHSDVVEAVTLGETDLFRAFHRLPGVTTRDDFTAELWTRGAPWSQTRVYYDGLPLFNPVHTVGVFTGVNPDAVGSVSFLPGVRSAAIGEGAAAALDITSRPATGDRLRGFGELSMVSARTALDDGFGKRGGWMLAARRSYVDLITALLADSSAAIPYAFFDLAGRADVPVGASSTVQVSGLWERDDVRGNVRDILRSNLGHWGNRVARATFAAPLGGLYLRETVGVSRFDGDVQLQTLQASRSVSGIVSNFVTLAPTSNGLTYFLLRTALEPAVGSPDARWSLGWDLVDQRLHYDGPYPRPYPGAILSDTLRLDSHMPMAAFWGQLRVRRGPASVEGGLRLEAMRQRAGVPSGVAVGPRVEARVALSSAIAVSAGYGRSFQYTQAIAPAGAGVGPDLHLTDVWLMADDTTPAIRSDVYTLGAEAWLAEGWLAAANLYARRATGVAVPDPFPGTLDRFRPISVSAVNHASGIELSLRRLIGRWTGSLGYTYGVSRLDALGWSYPSPNDRRHILDATALWNVSRPLRLGAAFTAASGAPYTRFYLEQTQPCAQADTLCELALAAKVIERPDANRTRPYVTLDLLADWTREFPRWSLNVYLQLRNALGRRNAVTYSGSYDRCTPGPGDIPLPGGGCDTFDRGLPLFPLVGVSLGF